MANEPKGHGSISRPLLSLIRQADPNFMRDRRRHVEYEFSNGRKFIADPEDRWPYNSDDPIEPLPPVYVLREDGSFVLREDGTPILRG